MNVCILNISKNQSCGEADSGTLYDVSALIDDQPYTFMVSIEDVGLEEEKIRIGDLVGETYWDILHQNAGFVTEICKLTFTVHAHRPLAFPVVLDESDV